MIRSLIDIYRYGGWLPDCQYFPSNLIKINISMSFCKGITQGGSNADTLLTDAYIKGIKDVPWEDAFHAIRKVAGPKIAVDDRTQKSNPRIGESKDVEISSNTIV
jgi:putative alpha-1,2-mannosidase